MFEECIKIVLQHEGGCVNHPSDPGGETKYGISKRAFPCEDIPNLTIERAKEIYREAYWNPLNLHLLKDDELALHVFDHAVNAGRKTAVKMLQRILECEPDGALGPVTAGCANKDKKTCGLYIRERYRFYIRIAARRPAMQVFLKGWINRVKSTKL